MAWQDVVSLNKLSVEIEDSTSQGVIYGNGRNQIGVVIYLEALDSSRNPVSISPEEIIQHAWLIDSVTEKRLNWKEDKSWNYTDMENDYHSIPSPRLTKQGSGKKPTYYVQCGSDEESRDKSIDFEVHLSNASVYIESNNHSIPSSKGTEDSSGTTAKFYVQCTSDEKQRNKSIAVEVELTNPSADPKTYSTGEHGTSGFLSKVHLTALEEETYTMDDMKLEQENTADGNKNISYKEYTCVGWTCWYADTAIELEWDQDNYYFSINRDRNPGFYIKHAEISGCILNDGDRQVSKNAFYNRFPEENQSFFNVGYIWEISDKPQTKNVTIYKPPHVEGDGYIMNDISLHVIINQKPHAICLTRMSYGYDTSVLSPDVCFWRCAMMKQENLDMSFLPPGTHIFIYDQYGNKGEFHARPDDDNGWGNLIKILDGPYIK